MKSIKTITSGKVLLGLLFAAAPILANAGSGGKDIHGWAIDEAGQASVAVYDMMGFSDPRAGQGDYGQSPYLGTSLKVDANGELGFDDPRPEE